MLKSMRPVAISALTITACAALFVVTERPDAQAAPAANAPPAAFSACAACHSVVAGQKRLGPNLSGVAGRRAGTLNGYAYSPALASSGLTWDAATLNRWIANPRATVPGNKMPYAGMQDAAKRQQIVAYLMTLK